MPSLAAAVAALALAGCIDFIDPNLPPPGPAIAQLFVHMLPGGSVQVEAHVQPGLSPALEFRKIPDDSLRVQGRAVAPTTVHGDGTRDYLTTQPLGGAQGPVLVQLPAVAGLAQSPPELRWYAMRRLDPDTVLLQPGADLHLHLDPSLPPETPPALGQQWFLQLAGGGHNFQLGADGPPPGDLRVPVEFLPGDSTSTLSVSLLVLRGGNLGTNGGDYLVNVSVDQRVSWTVLRARKGP